MPFIRPLLVIALESFGLAGLAFAETPPEEEKAVEAIRRVASNLQKNRDGTVRFVRFSKPAVEDEHLKQLRAFERIDYLAVVTPTVGDAGLAHIAKLKNLDTLFLSNSGLTDAGADCLAELTKLERLYLDGTKIGDEGLAHLEKLAALKTLSLNDTPVGDAGVGRLGHLAELEELSLAGTRVTDEALKVVGGLKRLKSLRLSRTRIVGDGLQHLKSLDSLETLDLCGTPLEADRLAALCELPKLKQVLLYDVELAPDVVAELRRKAPKRLVVNCDRPAGREAGAFERFLAGELGSECATEDSPEEADRDHAASPLLPPARQRFASGGQTPDFQRHVIPLLGRLGCNGRSCHGSFQGKGGFRLSMFGYDFAADYEALVESGRVDTQDPDESLVVLKPTLQEDHEGGQRYASGGWEHKLLRSWIAAGAPGVEEDAPELLRLDVDPREIVFQRPGDSVQLKVVATWSDGTREDVTCLARFQSNDECVAEVTPDGLVRCVGPGDTYVISFYDNGVFSTAAMLPVSEGAGERYPEVPTPTKIDELIVAKLSKLGIVPSEVCGDEEFLRRVSLDIAGTLPTPDEVREFLADPSPDKRDRKIEELLQRPAYVEWWTNWLCDLTGCNPQFLGTTDMNRSSATQWQDWMRRRVRDNVGWDEIAAGVLLATSRRPGQTYEEYAAEQSAYMRRENPEDFTAPDNPMHYYWFRANLGQPEDRALSFGYAFLGVRLECAQCHKHPFDRWSKQEFEQFTQFFTRIKRGAAPDALAAQRRLKEKLGVPVKLNTASLRRQMYQRVAAEGLPIPWNEIYVDPPGDKPQPAKLLGAAELDLSEYDDPREPLVAWLTSGENPYFARAMVNRVWARLFHSGIVEPADDFNQANPPSNKALLDWLSAEFVRHGYDLKWLIRTIAASDAYQRSWRPNETNRLDERNFSRAVLRRLPAEVAIDAILQATANDAKLQKLAREVAGRKIAQHPLSIQARGIDYSLLVFGKPLRNTNCDCERQAQPTLLQSLYVRNDHETLGWLERGDGWLNQLAGELNQTLSAETAGAGKASAKDNNAPVSEEQIGELIQEAYLRTLSRAPEAGEIAKARRHIAAAANTVEGLRDVMWALLNTQEFLTNH